MPPVPSPLSSPRSPSPSQTGFPLIDRRTALTRLLAAAGLVATPALAACGGGSEGGGGATETVTFGSNYSDQVPKDAIAKALAEAGTAAGVEVRINTVDHASFQENINLYLQGTPDDVFAWFAGYRMRFFAERGLASPINDVWETIGGNYSDALKAASTGTDGRQYLVPFYYYPWAVFYRKSLFAEKGYAEPKTLDEFTALCKQMARDNLIPVSFADKDGWPAMGTFDILNMRINGYDYHINLLAGKEGWDTPKTREVFQMWASLLPYHAPGALGRTWQEGAQLLQRKKAGMYMFGMFVGEQFPASERDDIDFFTFPEINPEFGRDSLDAPVDGFMLSPKPKNAEAAKRLLEALAGGAAVDAYVQSNPTVIAASDKATTTGYSALQKKAIEVISSAKHVAQYLDRDTRPDFASTVVIPSIQEFLRNPKDINGITTKLEQQKKAIFTA